MSEGITRQDALNFTRYFIYIPLGLLVGIYCGTFGHELFLIYLNFTEGMKPSGFKEFLYFLYHVCLLALAGIPYALVVSLIVPKTSRAGFYIAIVVWGLASFMVSCGLDTNVGQGEYSLKTIGYQRVANIIQFLISSAIILLVMRKTVRN